MSADGVTAIQVRFTPDFADLALVAEQRRLRGHPAWYRRLVAIFCSAFGAFVCGVIAYKYAAHRIDPAWPLRHVPWTTLGVVVFSGATIVFSHWISPRSMFPDLRVGGEVDLRFDDVGLTFAGRNALVIPWRRIASVNDTDAAIVFTDDARSILTLPKRAFADEGAALWIFLESRLIGRRNLIQSSRRRRLIVNSSVP